MAPPKRVAVVTGGNRGLGYFVCRDLARLGLAVVMGSRDETRGEAAAAELRAEGLDVRAHRLDVTSDSDILLLEESLRAEFGRLDVLVNNAGIKLELGDPSDVLSFAYYKSAFEVDVDTIRRTLETNLYGAYRMAQVMAPMMRDGGYGRIVNVSSGWGQFAAMYPRGGHPAYRASKAVLNVHTVIFHNELKDTNVLVNAIDPGWMRTDMGGPHADRSTVDAAAELVWLATLPDGGPSGGFFRRRERIAW